MMINFAIFYRQCMSHKVLNLPKHPLASIGLPHTLLFHHKILRQSSYRKHIWIHNSSRLLSFRVDQLSLMPRDHIELVQNIVHLFQKIGLSHDEVLVLVKIVYIVVNLFHDLCFLIRVRKDFASL